MMPGGAVRPLWRWVFFGYALLLAVLTHWPHLAVRVPIDRPDLLIHAGVFCVWIVLLERSGLLGRFIEDAAVQWRRLAWYGMVAGAFAAVDEWTQQFVGRVTALDDFVADVVGVGIGMITIVVLGLRQRWHRGRKCVVALPPDDAAPAPEPQAVPPPEQG